MADDWAEIFGLRHPTNERGAYLTRQLPDGRVIDVYPLTFGRARITISRSMDWPCYEDGW